MRTYNREMKAKSSAKKFWIHLKGEDNGPVLPSSIVPAEKLSGENRYSKNLSFNFS